MLSQLMGAICRWTDNTASSGSGAGIVGGASLGVHHYRLSRDQVQKRQAANQQSRCRTS